VIVIILIATFFGPEEKALGSNVRVVYLHGAWVLTAEIAFIAAALMGALGCLRISLRRYLRAKVYSMIGPRRWGAPHYLLGDLSAAVAVGHGIQLEWSVSG